MELTLGVFCGVGCSTPSLWKTAKDLQRGAKDRGAWPVAVNIVDEGEKGFCGDLAVLPGTPVSPMWPMP